MSYRISTRTIADRSVAAMLQQQTRLSDTQQQLSTGRRVLTPADDPAGAARILGYNHMLDTVAQYQVNAGRAQARLEQEEAQLTGVENLLQRTRELTVRGNNDSLSREDKGAIAVEIRQLLEHMYGIANTRDENGEYLFAGYQSKTQPFSRPTADTFVYAGDPGRRQLQISSDRQIADGDNGYDVFVDVGTSSGGKRNVFETLYHLAADLEQDKPVGDYLTDLDLALGKVLETRSSVGARMNAIDEQRELNADLQLTLETQRSREGDLDYTEAIARFNRQMTALQAAQQAYVKVHGLSLFNFL